MQHNPLPQDTRLVPSQVYATAVGMIEELVRGRTFELVHIEPGTFQGVAENARVYRDTRNNQLHILYYPGRDIHEPGRSITAESLQTIRKKVDEELEKIARNEKKASQQKESDESNLINTRSLQEAKKHFIVAEVGKYGPVNVDHFIYAMREKDELITEDSIKRKYDQTHIKTAIMGDTEPSDYKPYGYDWQNKVLDTWQCGHYSLQALHRRTHGSPLPQPNFFQKHPRVKYGLIALAVVLGIAGIVAASVATFGILPAVLVPVGFAVGGALAVSGIGLGITLKLLINKYKIIAQPSQITPEIQATHSGYYNNGKKSIEGEAKKRNPPQDDSSDVDMSFSTDDEIKEPNLSARKPRDETSRVAGTKGTHFNNSSPTQTKGTPEKQRRLSRSGSEKDE